MTAPRSPSAIRVLVIDDSTVARTSLVELLSEASYLVFSLPSAIGATRIIYQHSIQVVLVDLGMPGLSGDRLIGVLRKNPRMRDLIVVVVSGESDDELARLANEPGIDAVLHKRDVKQHLLPLLGRVVSGANSAEREAVADAVGTASPGARR